MNQFQFKTFLVQLIQVPVFQSFNVSRFNAVKTILFGYLATNQVIARAIERIPVIGSSIRRAPTAWPTRTETASLTA